MEIYKEQINCRNCGGDLENILDLGEIYPSAFISHLDNIEKAPLTLAKCYKCYLVQLRHTVSLDLMYRKYWYKSGLNSEMVEHLKDVVESINKLVKFRFGDVVVDIGANDGTMLDFYPSNLQKIAFEPAYNLADGLKKHCDHLVSNYFDKDHYPITQKAKIVTAIAMIYDLPNPNKFLQDVYSILEDDGIFVSQFSDLYSMLKWKDFSAICHEHLEYYDLKIIKEILSNNGFRVFDVERNKVNGGSLRIYADKAVRTVNDRVRDQLSKEESFFSNYYLIDFAKDVRKIKLDIDDFINKEVEKGKTFYVLGAGTKGNTILQYLELDDSIISGAADANPNKWGLKTVGTNIPISSDDEIFSKNPDYFIVLPWFFINNFIAKYYEYIHNGGIFLVPLPEPELVTNEGWKNLKGKVISNDRFI